MTTGRINQVSINIVTQSVAPIHIIVLACERVFNLNQQSQINPAFSTFETLDKVKQVQMLSRKIETEGKHDTVYKTLESPSNRDTKTRSYQSQNTNRNKKNIVIHKVTPGCRHTPHESASEHKKLAPRGQVPTAFGSQNKACVNDSAYLGLRTTVKTGTKRTMYGPSASERAQSVQTYPHGQ